MIHAALLFRKWALPTFVVRRSISRPFSFHHHHHHVRYFWDHSIFTDSKPSSSSSSRYIDRYSLPVVVKKKPRAAKGRAAQRKKMRVGSKKGERSRIRYKKKHILKP